MSNVANFQDAYQAKCTRILKNSADNRLGSQVAGPAYCRPENKRIGSKHYATSKLDVAEIAKLVRKDISQAIKLGALAKGTKVSVRIERYSMGCSLSARITSFNGPVYRGEYVRATANFTDFFNDEARQICQNGGRYTGEFNSALERIEAIVAAYHYDNSDSMSDYYSVNFSMSVDVSSSVTDAAKELQKIPDL